MTPPLDLRPLATGEVIDRSVRLWRTHWKAAFLLFFPFELAAFSLLKLYAFAVSRWFPYAQGGARAAEAAKTNPVTVLEDFGMAVLMGLPTFVVYLGILALLSVGASHWYGRLYLGEESTLRDGTRTMVRRLPTAVAALLLSTLWIIALMVVSLVPGATLIALGSLMDSGLAPITLVALGVVTMVFGLLCVLLWWVLRFLFLYVVVGIESGSAIKSLRRCRELISGRTGPGVMGRTSIRATVLVTGIGAILFAAQFISSLPTLIVQFIYANPFKPNEADLDNIPSVFLIPAQLLQVMTQSLVGPLFTCFCVVFYLDMRVRREGLDLELRLKSSTPPSKVAA